jgi:hypothetical protein
MTQANLLLRFLLELAAIVAVAYWGYHAVSGPVRLVLAVAAPIALIVFWAVVVAPGASNPIPGTTRMLIGSAVLLLAAGALYLAGQRPPALGMAVLVIVNTGLTLVVGE